MPGDTGTDTADVAVTTEPVNETASEPQVTVAIPGEEGTGTPAESATTPQESPIGLLAIIGGAGAGAVLLSRKR
ncbi:hypothetical protein MKMG_01929 [Methanogenium sp. MK-MG]|nr:hypothetical protein MKMG_01929 [Methanogenium sp. MK-MG]